MDHGPVTGRLPLLGYGLLASYAIGERRDGSGTIGSHSVRRSARVLPD